MKFHPDLFFFIIIFLFILYLFIRIIYSRIKKRPLSKQWTKAIKYLGQLSLGLGVLLQLIDLSSALGQINSSLTAGTIAGGLRATLFSTLHGLIVYLFALVLFIILRLTGKMKPG